jgi:hypothetical protein
VSQRLGRHPPLVVSAPTTTSGRRARPVRTPSSRSSPREAAEGHRSGLTRTLPAIDGLSAGERSVRRGVKDGDVTAHTRTTTDARQLVAPASPRQHSLFARYAETF